MIKALEDPVLRVCDTIHATTHVDNTWSGIGPRCLWFHTWFVAIVLGDVPNLAGHIRLE